jgi:hypothetical protein
MNRKTILKIGKLTIWVSGPNTDPYRHMYYKYKGKEEKGLRIFPKRWPSYTPGEADVPANFKKKMSIVLFNETPKWLKFYLETRAMYKNWEFYNSEMTFDGIELTKKKPLFVVYLIGEIKKAIRHETDEGIE